MEEQPRDRPPERHYPRHQHPHAEDRPSAADLNGVKHEQIHIQHQETQAKKTGSRRLNSGPEQDAEKTPGCPPGMSHPHGSHGNRHVINSTLKQAHPGAATSSTLASPAGPPRAAGRNAAAAELRRQQSSDQLRPGKDKEAGQGQGQGEAKHGAVPVPNGLTCGPLTNGYSSGKPGADGPGGEGGHAGQKKPRARGAMVRNAEHVIREAERDPRGPPSPDALDKGLSARLEGPRAAPRGEGPGAAAVEPQRKNGEGKAVAVFGKKPEEKHKGSGGGGGRHSSSPSKEDSWTLFKPPPVFPVDNSSAKIVPKISYASKVKENLNNKEAAAAAAAAVAPPPAPVRLSQVPMSAMKTISSVSFTNGPLPGNGPPLAGTYFAPGAAPASCLPAGEAVAPAGPGGEGDAFELKKCALLIYPLNMQPVLPSARPHDPQAAQTNQKALGEIFQNQWGLSFINEPGLGAEGGDKVAAGPPAPEPVTFAPDSRRTCVPLARSATFGPLSPEREDEDKHGLRGLDKTRLEPRGPAGVGGGGAAQAREGGAKTGPSSLPTLTFGSSKDRSPPGGLDRRASWGAFDVRAAVTYHTKEIEYIFNLQKQDPKRVVVYKESHDGAHQ